MTPVQLKKKWQPLRSNYVKYSHDKLEKYILNNNNNLYLRHFLFKSSFSSLIITKLIFIFTTEVFEVFSRLFGPSGVIIFRFNGHLRSELIYC